MRKGSVAAMPLAVVSIAAVAEASPQQGPEAPTAARIRIAAARLVEKGHLRELILKRPWVPLLAHVGAVFWIAKKIRQ